MEMVVVSSPQSKSDMDRYVAALSAVGLHPITAFQDAKSGLFQDKPAEFPVLVPKAELARAEAIIRAVDGGVPKKDQYEPPVATMEQFKRAAGMLGVLVLVIVGITGVVLLLQFLGGLLHHGH